MKKTEIETSHIGTSEVNVQVSRPLRADAQRSEDALLSAALEVFTKSGVDAPVREIAKEAGVGIGTLYRRFPQRSDLIIAVFRQQVDSCADAAPIFASQLEPTDALICWIKRYSEFLLKKRGLATALHSGDSTYASLPAYFDKRLLPALRGLLDAAVATREIRNDVEPNELLRAIGYLCCSPIETGHEDYVQRMVMLLVDGLRYGANSPAKK